MKVFLVRLSMLLALCGPTHAAIYEPDFAVALIHHELASESYLAANRDFVYFVTVDGADLTPQQRGALSNTGLQYSTGAWRSGGMRMDIGAPVRRSDGDFDVAVGYVCGKRCGATHTVVMRLGPPGWQVVSSTMQSISRLDGAAPPSPVRNDAKPEPALSDRFGRRSNRGAQRNPYLNPTV